MQCLRVATEFREPEKCAAKNILFTATRFNDNNIITVNINNIDEYIYTMLYGHIVSYNMSTTVHRDGLLPC